ncbi:uncharacterized protein METZ01_LOCUS382518, partial [marine metagenome]
RLKGCKQHPKRIPVGSHPQPAS